MNEEEMQFARPDWQPPGPASPRNEVPLPVSSPPPAPSSSSRPARQSTSGSAAHEPVSCGAVVAGSIFMIVLSLVIAAILAPIGSSSSANPLFATPQVTDQITTVDPGSSSLVQISNDGSVPIDIVTGDTSQITVDIPPATDNPRVRISSQQEGTSIALPDLIPTSEADTITIRLPASISQLDLTTSEPFAGDITITGYTGQLSVQTPGQLSLEDDTLQGRSTLSATSLGEGITLDQVHLRGNVTITAGYTANLGIGAIRFQGTLDPQGTYAFHTDSGPLDLTVPANTSMQVHHTITGTAGSYHNDFSSDMVGKAPWAQVSLTTTDGDISVNKGGESS